MKYIVRYLLARWIWSVLRGITAGSSKGWR